MRNLESYTQWICLAKREDVPELATLASELPSSTRAQVLAGIQYQLTRPDVHAQEDTLVALAKLLIAMVPDSWTTIRTLIKDREHSTAAAEVRFSVFCFLDELPHLPGGCGLVSEAARLVGGFLLHVESNAGRAAWMAGDLLGDHWDLNEGVPILINVLANGKYTEGRLASLHGLEHALDKTDRSSTLGGAIVRAVAQAASKDRSGRVRESAKRVYNSASACHQNGSLE